MEQKNPKSLRSLQYAQRETTNFAVSFSTVLSGYVANKKFKYASRFQVVKNSTGSCSETMSRKFWDVQAFVGRTARVKLVDFSSGGWGHINFDDLGGDISCGQK